MKEYHLEPKTKPIVIYQNNMLTNTTILNKYKPLLNKEIIKKDGKSWSHVKKLSWQNTDMKENNYPFIIFEPNVNHRITDIILPTTNPWPALAHVFL